MAPEGASSHYPLGYNHPGQGHHSLRRRHRSLSDLLGAAWGLLATRCCPSVVIAGRGCHEREEGDQTIPSVASAALSSSPPDRRCSSVHPGSRSPPFVARGDCPSIASCYSRH